MVLDASLLNTQQYKVGIKGKVEQFREKEKRPRLHLGVVAIEKGALGTPSTKVANFTFYIRGCPLGVMIIAIDSRIVMSEFELQSCYYVHFRTNTLGKGMG